MIKRVLLTILFVTLLMLPACTKQWDSPPPMTIDQGKEYYAAIDTNYGDIEVKLLPGEAPVTVNNFVFLAREGFYDGLKFYRVVKGFVIQAGDPTHSGTGGPGYEFEDEEVTRDYVAGTLAMANHGSDTNGSQFFITLADLPNLPKNYTIFGIVTDGFSVAKKIGNVSVSQAESGEWSLPDADVRIESITITEK
jgi:cyclophilin family peptidyl-prolyl cis-trans isomerase